MTKHLTVVVFNVSVPPLGCWIHLQCIFKRFSFELRTGIENSHRRAHGHIRIHAHAIKHNAITSRLGQWDFFVITQCFRLAMEVFRVNVMRARFFTAVLIIQIDLVIDVTLEEATDLDERI